MRHTIEHVLVMDTDDLPGRGGYGVVGISAGVRQEERLFAAENFGISDYLHDPQNDRLFFSVLRVPGGRRALVRRFANGLRRNGTQNRLFVHTLFFDDATWSAVHGLPWLLDDALTTDRDALLRDPSFPAIEWNEDAAITAPPVQRFQSRMKQVERWLAQAGLSVSAADAIAAVIAGFQSGRRVVLPQGPLFEQLTLLAWSMLPARDREQFAWTQHSVGAQFEIANAVAAPTIDVARGATDVARRIVEMNTASAETWAEFHRETARFGLSARGDDIPRWYQWRSALRAAQETPESSERLAALANTKWFDPAEVLQLVWDGARHDLDRWAELLSRSGAGSVLFRVLPPDAWLEAAARDVGEHALARFLFRFAAGDARAQLATWLLSRPSLHSETLALICNALMNEPVSDRLFDALTAQLRDDERTADVWLRFLLRRANDRDIGSGRIRVANVDVAPLAEHLESHPRAGRGMRELILATRPAWTPRLADAIANAAGTRSTEWEPILAAVAEDFGETRATRIPLAWRALRLGNASEQTLNALDEDLWSHERAGYERQMSEALQLFAGKGALRRVSAWLALLASRDVMPSVKFVCERLLGETLASLTADEWTSVVSLPKETLFARANAALLLARHLGSSGAAEAAELLEESCRRRDVLDAIAYGRVQQKRRFRSNR